MNSTFGEFGIGFVHDVFTPDVLDRHIDAALSSSDMDVDFWPGLASASLRVTQPGKPGLVGDDPCELVYEIPVQVAFRGTLGTPPLLGSALDADLGVRLICRVRTFAPATVNLHFDEVAAADIDLDLKVWSGWISAVVTAGYYIAGEVAQEAVKPLVARYLNDRIAESAQQRIIDVLGKVAASQTAEGPVLPSATRALPAPVVGADHVFTGVLEQGQRHVYGVWLARGEEAHLSAWVGVTERQPLIGSGGVIFNVNPLSGGGRELPEGFAIGMVARRWRPDYDFQGYRGPDDDLRGVFPAGPGGLHKLEVAHTDPLSDDVSVEYRIEQSRVHTAVTGPRVCFDQFGDNLIRQGISASLIAGAVNGKLPRGERLPVGEVGDLAAAVVVDARLEKLDQFVPKDEPGTPPGTAFASKLWFRPVIGLELELEAGLKSKPSVYKVRLTARMSLFVTTRSKPATIEVTPKEATDQDVTIASGPTHVRGPKIPFAGKVLESVLPGVVAAALNQKLAGAKVAIVVKDVVAAMPVPVPAPKLEPLAKPLKVSGSCPENSERWHGFNLAAGQKVKIKARLAIDRKSGSGGGINVDVAVCDRHGGVLDSDFGTVKAVGKSRNTFALDFRAPVEGEYKVRFRETYMGTDAPGFVYDLVVEP